MCTNWFSVFLAIIYLFVWILFIAVFGNNDKHGVRIFNEHKSLKCSCALKIKHKEHFAFFGDYLLLPPQNTRRSKDYTAKTALNVTKSPWINGSLPSSLQLSCHCIPAPHNFWNFTLISMLLQAEQMWLTKHLSMWAQCMWLMFNFTSFLMAATSVLQLCALLQALSPPTASQLSCVWLWNQTTPTSHLNYQLSKMLGSWFTMSESLKFYTTAAPLHIQHGWLSLCFVLVNKLSKSGSKF